MDEGWKQPHGWVDGIILIVAIIVALLFTIDVPIMFKNTYDNPIIKPFYPPSIGFYKMITNL
jgi:hypothetical protein